MVKIPLSQGMIALVDDADFKELSKYKWCVQKSKQTYYARAGWLNGKRMIMHRFLLGLNDPKTKCDHADGNGLNNQRLNIRQATNSENSANRSSRGSSVYLGVCKFKGKEKWTAAIRKDNKKTYLGIFKCEKEAALAYNKAASKIHGEFARLNII